MCHVKMQVTSQVGKLRVGIDMVTSIYDSRIVVLMASNLTMVNLSLLWLIFILTFTPTGKFVFVVSRFLSSTSLPLLISNSFPPPSGYFLLSSTRCLMKDANPVMVLDLFVDQLVVVCRLSPHPSFITLLLFHLPL
jgi:hypothetical protein